MFCFKKKKKAEEKPQLIVDINLGYQIIQFKEPPFRPCDWIVQL